MCCEQNTGMGPVLEAGPSATGSLRPLPLSLSEIYFCLGAKERQDQALGQQWRGRIAGQKPMLLRLKE
jgi:hypothetical protein